MVTHGLEESEIGDENSKKPDLFRVSTIDFFKSMAKLGTFNAMDTMKQRAGLSTVEKMLLPQRTRDYLCALSILITVTISIAGGTVFHFVERPYYEREHERLSGFDTNLNTTDLQTLEKYFDLKSRLEYQNRWKFGHSAYFALNIASTIGSDHTPRTTAGKVFLLGFALLAIPIFLASATLYTGFFLSIPGFFIQTCLEFEMQARRNQLHTLLYFSLLNSFIVAIYFALRLDWTLLAIFSNMIETSLTLRLGLVPDDSWHAFDFVVAFHFHLSAVGSCMLLLGILSDNITQLKREMLNEAMEISRMRQYLHDLANETPDESLAKIRQLTFPLGEPLEENQSQMLINNMKSCDLINEDTIMSESKI